jgi:hypothetical protein
MQILSDCNLPLAFGELEEFEATKSQDVLENLILLKKPSDKARMSWILLKG